MSSELDLQDRLLEGERLKRYHPQLQSLSEIQSELEEDEYEDRCAVREDTRCMRPATATIEEPYTPGRFTLRMCDEHAQSAISRGYKLVK